MFIRMERADDHVLIDAVHRAAFADSADHDHDPVEVQLVRALRDDHGWVPALSLVADEDRAVVGHVVATEGTLGGVAVLGIGPLGVLPARHGHGVGSALMHAVVAAGDALDYPAVVLLGAEAYYARFGFLPARTLGITAPDPSWGDHFQARALHRWSPSLAGPYRYAAPFDDL